MAAKVYITNRQKLIKIPAGARTLIRRCCSAVLVSENIRCPAEVSVSFIDNSEIRELNASFRHINLETDVLSFPLFDDGKIYKDPTTGQCILGDIVISMEKAVEQARLYGHSLERELGFLTVHSMFHLLGYDHEKGGIDAQIMREKEEAILTELGLSREQTFLDENELKK